MTWFMLEVLGAGLVCVAAFHVLPRHWGPSAVAVLTLAFLIVVSPATAAWLLATTLGVHGLMLWRDRRGGREAAALAASLALGAGFFALRDLPAGLGGPVPMLGVAYFTLRQVHMLAEWAWGRLPVPALGGHLRYHLLLPVLASGPIHRFPHFERAERRRRRSAEEFFAGAERTLLGAATVMIVGDFLLGPGILRVVPEVELPRLAGLWVRSAFDWVRLYVHFAGFTGIALGLCLMMGLRLEENFDRPWRARSLTDFWLRWHMTLSHWCRDYVFVPVAALTRSPVAGVAAALLAIGVWHQASLYYVLWAVWQTLGIVSTHMYRRLGDPLRIGRWPAPLVATATPVFILAWLSAAVPVISGLLGVMPR